jgi:hypothetical protein
MPEASRVQGISLFHHPETHDNPILRDHAERLGIEAYRARYHEEPNFTHWYYDHGGEYDDPDEEGQTFTMPPRWCLLVEGVVDARTDHTQDELARLGEWYDDHDAILDGESGDD